MALLLRATVENNNRDHKIRVTVLLELLWSECTEPEVSMSDCTPSCGAINGQGSVGNQTSWSLSNGWSGCALTHPSLPRILMCLPSISSHSHEKSSAWPYGMNKNGQKTADICTLTQSHVLDTKTALRLHKQQGKVLTVKPIGHIRCAVKKYS